jgi:predicted phage terminase large subunit-like protein
VSVAVQQRQEVIRPQEGPQEMFLRSSADIAVYGGSAGGGKSFALLMEPLRHVNNERFGAVIFRRTYPEIKNEGGLWDESSNIYPLIGARPRETTLEWEFKSGAKVKFAHMQLEKDKYSWQGAQIPLLGWDELTHFSASQFFYMLSRNRSTCGVKPYIRATTNPDADSWVKSFLSPWIDSTFPNPAESGEIRWFIREGGQIIWCDPSTPFAKSVTFIRSSIYDNKILLEKNPEYLANLKALPLVERMRLLEGDWSIRPSGNKFKRGWFELIDVPPGDLESVVRYWDLAATEPKDGNDPDYTAGVKIGRKNDIYYVLDVQRERLTPGKIEQLIKNIAAQDGTETVIYMEQEPGSSGVNTIATYRRLLAGYQFRKNKTTGSKELRANVASSQAEGGNVKVVKSYWNDAFLNELSAFPTKGVHDDQADAFSGAMEKIIKQGRVGGMFIDTSPPSKEEQYYEPRENEIIWR